MVYDLLREFHDPEPARTRYIKIWGNHDLDWQDDAAPLRTVFPGIEVYEAALMRAGEGEDILLIHGHQADPVCSGWRERISRWMVRNLWRRIQASFGGQVLKFSVLPGVVIFPLTSGRRVCTLFVQ